MAFVKQIGGAAVLGAAMLIGAGLCAPPAQAAYTVTLAQVGSNVVATGSGTIDLTGLTRSINAGTASQIGPALGDIITGPVISGDINVYTGFTGPTSFGSGGTIPADSGSGDTVGIDDYAAELVVPAGYVSGGSLSGSATFDNETFSSLGVTPGTYVWTWGAVASVDDSFTLEIPAAAVPEPSSVLLLALPLGLVILLAARLRPAPRNTRMCRDITLLLAS